MTQETSHATDARILAETHFEISEFLKLFSPLLKRHLIGEDRQRSFSRLALCEIMTILVAHQIIGAPNLKHFYQKIIWQYHHREFPGLISYSRFIGIAAIAVVPLTLYLRFRMEMSRHTGLSVIDSTPLRVCMNLRIPRHQAMSRSFQLRSFGDEPTKIPNKSTGVRIAIFKGRRRGRGSFSSTQRRRWKR